MFDLNDRRWEAVNLIDNKMFTQKKYKTISTTSLSNNDAKLDIVGATSKNNGNVFFADKSYKHLLVPKGLICLIKTGQGSVGDAVYKGNDFIPSNNVAIIKKQGLNKYTGLFVTTLINKCSDRYSYGYIRNDARISREKNMYPVTESANVDWQFMEKYTQGIIHQKIIKYKKHCQKKLSNIEYKEIEPLTDKKWGEFFVKTIFTSIQRGKRLTKNKQINGITPYISSTSLNNGVNSFIGNSEKVRMFSNCLTIANSGSVGATFYHPYKFIASDHVTHLENKKFNSYIYLFISCITNRLSSKYNFNREINDQRISREKIMLPVDAKRSPDYEYMEQYIRNIEYKKRKQYLDYINKEEE